MPVRHSKIKVDSTRVTTYEAVPWPLHAATQCTHSCMHTAAEHTWTFSCMYTAAAHMCTYSWIHIAAAHMCTFSCKHTTAATRALIHACIQLLHTCVPTHVCTVLLHTCVPILARTQLLNTCTPILACTQLLHTCTPTHISHTITVSLRCWEFWDQDTSRFIKGRLCQTVSSGFVLTWWKGPVSSLEPFVSALIWFKRVGISWANHFPKVLLSYHPQRWKCYNICIWWRWWVVLIVQTIRPASNAATKMGKGTLGYWSQASGKCLFSLRASEMSVQ